MSFARTAAVSRILICLCCWQAVARPTLAKASASAEPAAKGISLAEYRARLQSLDALLARCQGAMNAANCRSDQVGPDVQVVVGSGSRSIRFGWLRSLLEEAAKGPVTVKPVEPVKPVKPIEHPASPAPEKDSETESAPLPASPALTLEQRLAAARTRLAEDGRLADAAAGQPTANSSATAERNTLKQILSAKEYQAVVRQPSLLDRMFEKIGHWIGRAMEKLTAAGAKSRWLGLAAEIGFVVLLCVGLVWLLIRLERRGRFGIATIRPGVGESAASARDWQLWLADARQAAAKGDWRDAIHLTYWASISRLESSGLWPADRARTPREYLSLLSESHAQRPGLALLTRSFERTWYAGRPAAEADFRQAEQLAGRLGAR